MKTIIDKKTGKEITISDESYEALFPQKRWRPEYNETYYYVNSAKEVDFNLWSNDSIDNYRYKTRNVFRTGKEAEQKLHAIKKKYKILDVIEELNEDWKPNWANKFERKYFLYYMIDNKEWDIDFFTHHKELPDEFYFKSEEIGNQLIQEFDDNLKYLFTL